MKQREIPPFGLRLPPNLREWVQVKAKSDERSQNWFLVKLVEEAKARDEMQIGQA